MWLLTVVASVSLLVAAIRVRVCLIGIVDQRTVILAEETNKLSHYFKFSMKSSINKMTQLTGSFKTPSLSASGSQASPMPSESASSYKQHNEPISEFIASECFQPYLSGVGNINTVVGSAARIITSQIEIRPSIKIFVQGTMVSVAGPAHLAFASKSKINLNQSCSSMIYDARPTCSGFHRRAGRPRFCRRLFRLGTYQPPQHIPVWNFWCTLSSMYTHKSLRCWRNWSYCRTGRVPRGIRRCRRNVDAGMCGRRLSSCKDPGNDGRGNPMGMLRIWNRATSLCSEPSDRMAQASRTRRAKEKQRENGSKINNAFEI